MPHLFHYVYILRSQSNPSHPYIGSTTCLLRRLRDHNAGHSKHTSRHRPWMIETAIAFRSKHKAMAFEKYLKSGSGRAFARRHL